jgi:MerR family transcriptional regulator, light-induced transcriptional regulator
MHASSATHLPETRWLMEQYVAAQLAGDRRAALRLILEHGIEQGVPLPSLYLDVIQAAQHRIGELWQENRISVAQEHMATAITQVALAELYRALVCETPNGRRVTVACVGGELHELGTRVTADFFEMAGFDVRYLGANVPTDSVVGMVREQQPHLLVLSATTSLLNVADLVETARRSREALGSTLRLAVGGLAFDLHPMLIDQLGAEVYGRTAPESVVRARQVLGLDAS